LVISRFSVIRWERLTWGREKAFVTSEFKEYNPRVEGHIEKLVQILRGSGGQTVNVSKAMDNLVFDM